VSRRTIGVLIPVPDGFYYGDILWGISREALMLDLDVLVVSTATFDSFGLRISYDARVGWDLVDAWIIVAQAVSEAYARELAGTGKPLVTIADHAGLSDSAYVVKCDNRGASEALTRHLIEMGHRRIAFAGSLANADYRERFQGCKDAMEKAGIGMGAGNVYDVQSGDAAARLMLEEGLPYTAVFAASDLVASALVQQLTEAGVRVPEDVAVVGFDDSGIAKTCKPSLTTARQPIIELGRCALRRTMDILEGRSGRVGTTVLPVGVVIRESSGGKASDDLSENDQTLSWKNIPGEELEQLIESHRRLSLRLIDTRDMSWLRYTNQHWGIVGLWEGEPGASDLILDSAYSVNGTGVPETGSRWMAERFPPMPPLKRRADDPEFVLVQLIQSETRNWGLLVTAGPVNERFIRGHDTRQLPSLLGAMIDHRKLLAELEQREAGYAALAERLGIVSRTTHDGVFELKLPSCRIEWITGIKSLPGVRQEEWPTDGQAFLNLVHPEDVPRVKVLWEAAVKHRLPLHIEFRLKRGDEYIWVSAAGEIVTDAGGNAVRFLGAITDIHLRKMAERALLASEERYRAFFRNTPVMLLSLDEQFVITDANPCWLEAMGYEREEVIGASCLSFLTPESEEKWRAHWSNGKAETGIADMELQWVTRGGQTIDGLVNGRRYGEPGQARIYLSVRDITERKRAERQIHFLAYHDPLTGLPNRRMFYERLEQAIGEAKAGGTRVAVMMIDLDHFKVINDSLGHDMGDALLRLVAGQLADMVGGAGLVARIGGDEFTIMLTGGEAGEAAGRLAERIVDKLRQPFTVAGHDLFATASVGISRYPEDGVDIGELVKKADTAMYRAKQQGRNRMETYSGTMEEVVRERLAIGSRLRLSLDSMAGFYLLYQPQLDLKSGRLIGAEALIRWTLPDIGSVPPGMFIPLAEEFGMIAPIGEWVLREACRQLKAWSDRFAGGWHLSVNLSVKQLQQPGFVAGVDRIVAESGVDPGRLCFEITETAALLNLESCAQILNELRARGIRIALDDFGTGYSSLLLLKSLPLSIVKIDRSFTHDLLASSATASIVSGIIAMSKGLGMSVIAEGIETEEQLEALGRLGCEGYQGYYESRPLPPDLFERQYLADDPPEDA
jgi:diguanylate cyclase (GGDEF)-like protein/PAS domain S-box-containing protein